MLKLTERQKYLMKAKSNLDKVILEWLQRYELSTNEELLLIHEATAPLTRYVLRELVKDEGEAG